MFVRAKKGGNKTHPHKYLQIVESYRTGRTVRQRVICTLGRLDRLQESGEIDGLMRSLARFSETQRVLSASYSPDVDSCQARLWGPALVFGRLWEKQGIPPLLGALAADRRFQFDPERVAFALALQRLCRPGSDLNGSGWLKTVEAPGCERIQLQHMYRAVRWLAEIREELERELFFRDRDLFTQDLDLVFLDTTSTYLYRGEETEYARRGYSRDHRPDLPQMVLCVAVDRRSWPIAWEILPGNTADVKAFERAIAKLRERFNIRRVSVVADRAMLSQKTVKLLTEHTTAPFDFIIGCRLRGNKEVKEKVLSRGGRYSKVAKNLKVKEVTVDGRRYIVCKNEEEARKDAAARERIVAQLKEKLAKGQAKGLIGNSGYRRFLKGGKAAWRLDEKAVEDDSRFDGVFVLRTNLDLPASEIATTYKGLWRVERTFREEKSTLEVRPLFHHRDATRIGHIVASFLALRLEIDLQRKLEEKNIEVSWPRVMDDLARLQAVHITLDGKAYRIRTDLEGSAYEAFQAAGVRVPSRVMPLDQQKSVVP
jgi:hypothetical protein